MKKSFTLIEVLIATLIFFVVVGALLSVASDTKHLISLLHDTKNFNIKSSIVAIEQKNVKNLYEQLYDFNITNDKIIKTLKNEKIVFEKTIDSAQEINISQSLNFLEIINRLKIYDSEFANISYEIELK